MTEHYSFFDAIQDGNGQYDREYNAQQFTDYFKSLVTTGIMKGTYSELEVTTNGGNMASSVKSGVAFVEGRYYYNDALLDLMHDTEAIGLNRIDRLVIRMDLSTEARYVKAFIKKGVPDANPTAPALTRTAQIYEISLAQVLIVGGQTFIDVNAVTDERGNPSVCPWASSKILPSYDENLLNSHITDSNLHPTPAQKISWTNKVNMQVTYGSGEIDPNTTLESAILTKHANRPPETGTFAYIYTTFYGPIALNTNRVQIGIAYQGGAMFIRYYNGSAGWSSWVGTGDPRNLLTSNKTSIVGAVNELFTSVSNGKSLVANAITGKGVTTSPTAEFATMANNINSISTGKKWASGTTTPTASSINMPEMSGITVTLYNVEVSGLNFRPSVIDLYRYGTNGLNYFCSYSTHTFSATTPPSFRTGYYNRELTSNALVYRVALGNGSEVTNGGFKLGVTSQAYFTWVAYE